MTLITLRCELCTRAFLCVHAGRSWVRMVCEGPLRPNGAEMPHQDQSELFRQAQQLIEQSKNTLEQTKERLQKSHCKVTVGKNRKTQEETRINNSHAQKGRSQQRTQNKERLSTHILVVKSKLLENDGVYTQKAGQTAIVCGCVVPYCY